MNSDIRLTTSHVQTISEKQATALMLLGYSNAELQAYMEEEVLSNPFAEMEYPQEGEHGSTGRIEKRDEGARAMAYRSSISGSEPEDTASQTASVWDILGEQLPAAEMTDQAWGLAKTLVGYMDEDGYLRYEREELCRMTGAERDAVDETISLIQSLDPPGVGARDLIECLRLQLMAAGSGEDAPEVRIVSSYLEDMASNRTGKLARLLGVTENEVRAAFSKIRSLNPKPLNGLVGLPEPAVVPDMIFKCDGQGCSLAMNDYWMGVLRKSMDYDCLDKTDLSPEDMQYIRERRRHLDHVMNGIEFRRKTVLTVVEFILLSQMDYVLNDGALLPISMSETAGKLGMSISTVSRAVRGKYVETPKGVLSVRNLFSLPVIRGQNTFCANEFRKMLRETIAQEDKTKPLSDRKIASLLAQYGIPAARRTVTKYRTSMNIPCASNRKNREKERG